jgi:hypothetical protein
MSAGRRRRWVVLVLLLVVVGMVVAADRGAAWYAQQRLAEETAAWATRAGAPAGTKPAVRIEGFPFLTQVVRGEYDGIVVTARDVGAGGLVASRLDLHLRRVHLPLSALAGGDLARGRAEQVTATAYIPLSEFATALNPRGVTVRVEGNRLRIEVPFEIAGFKSRVTGLAAVEAVDGRLRVRLSDLRAAGSELPQSVADSVSQQLAKLVEAPQLPYGLKLDRVRVTPDGLVASASGRNVPLEA